MGRSHAIAIIALVTACAVLIATSFYCVDHAKRGEEDQRAVVAEAALMNRSVNFADAKNLLAVAAGAGLGRASATEAVFAAIRMRGIPDDRLESTILLNAPVLAKIGACLRNSPTLDSRGCIGAVHLMH